MPPRLLLDGEDLRSLMLRVRDEMGPEARIVKAERVRTGGLGGFFARERYELTVEVPEQTGPAARRAGAVPPRSTPASPGARTPVGLDALLAAAEAEERFGAGGPGAGAGGGGGSGAGAAGGAGTSEGPAVSTASETFAQVLESMQSIVAPAVDPSDVADRGNAPAGSDGRAGTAPSSSGTLVPPGRAGTPGVTVGTAPGTTPDEDAAGSGARTGEVRPGDESRTEESRTEESAAGGRPAVDEDRPGSSVTSLLELGIPARLLTGFTDPNAPVPLSQMVRRFAPAPVARLAPGNVVVLVGEPAAALRTAMQMAHRAGLQQRDIVLAGEADPVAGHGRRLQTRAAVARYRSRISSDALYIVVLGVPSEPERWAASAELLDALAPDQAWAVVDARRKAVELRRWMRVVAGSRTFDAIAASSTFDAQAPGTVLNLGVPVGWVDGLPASPLVWAAVLSERLADDARWD